MNKGVVWLGDILGAFAQLTRTQLRNLLSAFFSSSIGLPHVLVHDEVLAIISRKVFPGFLPKVGAVGKDCFVRLIHQVFKTLQSRRNPTQYRSLCPSRRKTSGDLSDRGGELSLCNGQLRPIFQSECTLQGDSRFQRWYPQGGFTNL